MALQPAAGARDLNPQQVEENHRLSKLLAHVYNLWGYEEVSPPRIERIDTLTAGGAISSKEIIKLVADDPLGLRPEMTASITRAACTRLAERPRPLRLWTQGTIFERKISAEGGLSIEERLKSGVEMIGESNIGAEIELLALLLASLEALELAPETKPTLLIGHTGLMDLILSRIDSNLKEKIKMLLIDYNNVGINLLNLNSKDSELIDKVINTRSEPNKSLSRLKDIFGDMPVLKNLETLFHQVQILKNNINVNLILDPTFQPHLQLYTGLVFQLICKGSSVPVVIASGGRYDDLVKKFNQGNNKCAGVGFSFSIEDIRELSKSKVNVLEGETKMLIAYNSQKGMEKAFKIQKSYHSKGIKTIVELNLCKSEQEVKAYMVKRECNKFEWIQI